ncbi:hypothetical protein CRM22_006530 [Opisthorchis felineus]|uniref:HIT domain-containing protein n=1 Tax=Opisthorchis felineus TaxID=147828 RepID=A0A4S2LKL3_OPIFE|nr:hypothetical protein CRM22_006530 [Opisthorchis felineus]
MHFKETYQKHQSSNQTGFTAMYATSRALSFSVCQIVEEMKSCAVEFLLENHKSDISHFRLGFHRPPFNSVSHLHLHVIGPLRYSVHEIMFNPRMGIFVPVDDLLESLRRKASEASSQ